MGNRQAAQNLSNVKNEESSESEEEEEEEMKNVEKEPMPGRHSVKFAHGHDHPISPRSSMHHHHHGHGHIDRRSSGSIVSPINIRRQTIVNTVSSSIVSAGPKLEWDYRKNGADWCFSDCNGYFHQSPIDIETDKVVPFSGPPISIKFHNRITHFHIVDNGVTFVTDLTKVSDAIATLSGPDVDGVKNKYELLQFHFHSPAEHTINSNKYDLEMHFVFQFKGDPNEGPKNYLSVMGLIFKVVPEIKPEMHDGRFLREFKCEGLGLDLTLNFFHLHGIFKESEYYAYKGSLTAVPCLEIVNWYLHKDIFYITENEIEPFRHRWVLNKHFSNGCGNNRVTQPLHDRTVYIMKSPIEERGETKSLHLATGEKIPLMGFSFSSSLSIDTHHLQSAIKHGFTHIQTGYFNTDEIYLGECLKMVLEEGGLFKREDLFLSGVYEPTDRIEKNIKRTLEDLGVEYLDLILLERPRDRDLDPEFINDTVRKVTNCWKILEEMKLKGIVKIIGVSNYDTTLLNELIGFTEKAPAVNMIEFHPFYQQRDVVNLCKKHKIALLSNGYSLPRFREEIKTRPKKFEQLIALAKGFNKNIRQILLNWMTVQGVAPMLIPEDFHYLKESFGFLDFQLSREQLDLISNLPKEQIKSYLQSALNEI